MNRLFSRLLPLLLVLPVLIAAAILFSQYGSLMLQLLTAGIKMAVTP